MRQIIRDEPAGPVDVSDVVEMAEAVAGISKDYSLGFNITLFVIFYCDVVYV